MVEVRGHLVGVGSPLLPCGSQGSKSGCQALQQDPLPAEPSLWPTLINFRSANGLNYWLGQRPHRHPEMCCGKLPPCLRGQPQESGLTITAGGGRKGLVGRKLAERIPPVSAGLHPLWGFGGDCRACIRVAPSGQGGSWVFWAAVNSHPSSVTVLRRWVCHTDGQRAFVQRNEGSGGLACTKVTRRK